MAVSDSMFLFEVVVENVKSLVEAQELVVRADFADVFSLDLKDPKQLNIVMPQPPPAPPEPPGKKGKKPKPPKPKKGKKGAPEPPPPPEPIIQSGQSVLYATSGEILLAVMKKNPLQVSLWNKEDNLKFIGSATIAWDQQHIEFLHKICACEKPSPSTVKGEYNIFNERTAKLMATVTIQIKLTFLQDKISSMFRSVPNTSPLDAGGKKCLYTGIHSKATSYMCSLKMSDTIKAETPAHVETTFVKQPIEKPPGIRYADYKNAPATNTTFFNEDGDYCCIGKADKTPESKYKAPKVMPDLDFVADYVRKVIRSCNENLRMLTPRPEIKPMHKATDIDRMCGCKRDWPEGSLAERMRTDPTTLPPCALCAEGPNDENPHTFEIHNIRGPCGKTDCRIAKHLRSYIEQLATEDNKQIDINEIIGPCGSRTCTLANRIQQFIRQEGIFNSGQTEEGLSTVCACEDKLQESLKHTDECDSDCSEECQLNDQDSNCSSPTCPSNKDRNNVYCVGYCTIVNDFNVENDKDDTGSDEERFKHCKYDCPSAQASTENKGCTRSRCETPGASVTYVPCKPSLPCLETCAIKDTNESADDSNIEINLTDIDNPCCVETCDVADKVKDFIIDGATQPRKVHTVDPDDPCYCDCDCKFGFTKKTTYCQVCGGYEVAGTDLKDKPPYAMPVPPCPVYHKLYDKNKFKLNSGWSTPDTKHKKGSEDAFKGAALTGKSSKGHDSPNKAASATSGAVGAGGAKPSGQTAAPKTGAQSVAPTPAGKAAGAKSTGQASTKDTGGGGEKKTVDKKNTAKKELTLELDVDKKEKNQDKKKVGKFTFNYGYKGIAPHIGHSRCHLPCNASPTMSHAGNAGICSHAGNASVPKNMGWLWTAEDVPGMKFRPDWRPGACNKRVVTLLRHHKNPEVAFEKKRKRELAKKTGKGKYDKKPLLIVSKKNGEYSVTMETMKTYQKPRTLNQFPYEDKPAESFFVGRTDEENAKRQKRLQRELRRKERLERQYIQKSFKNMCEEICMNTYRQAIGILKSHEDPECPCYPDKPDLISVNAGCSCSCSDTYSSSGSETDGDEWTLEFTPPIANYDPKFKPLGAPKHQMATQYTYLDYRVKLFDRHGNPVARFFKGLDGKEKCSDLGGFWSPSHHWIEINVDGYIGPDMRWVPNYFIGPDGQMVDSSTGKFQAPDGKWLVIGVDGYVDGRNKWVYHASRGHGSASRSPARTRAKSESSWSCFGDVTPILLAKRGIIGHGQDKKLLMKRLKDLQAAGENVHIPKPSAVPKSPYRPKTPPKKKKWADRYKCRHPVPSGKGVMSVDSDGNKTYFTADSRIDPTPEYRIKSLQKQGVSVSSYHTPCFHSFAGPEQMKNQKRSKLIYSDQTPVFS